MPVGSNQVTVTLSTELLQEVSNHAAEAGADDVASFIALVLEAIEAGLLWDEVEEAIGDLQAEREQ
jgi:3-methyladenine DNA glycosylase Tag